MVEEVNSKIANRLISLDAFRGITIALMLIADNPGNSLRVYPQLRHPLWNGWTLADLVFPFFVIIMGMAIPFALNKRLERGDASFAAFMHIAVRSILLLLIGLFLNGFPLFDLTVIRIPGVLQRLAIVYFVTGLIYLALNKIIINSHWKRLSIIISLAFGIVLIYALIFNFGPVPEHGNLIQKIDFYFLKGHLYTPDWDPEGILSTFPSIASGLFGLAAGYILTSPYKKIERHFITLFVGGVLFTFLGLILDQRIPINKNIWSSTYVLLTSGLAYIFIALLYFIIDLKKNVMVFKPFIILGNNPIIIYVISELIRKTLWVIPIKSQVHGATMPMNAWLTTTFFTPWAGDWLDSLYFSIFYVLIWAYFINLNRR